MDRDRTAERESDTLEADLHRARSLVDRLLAHPELLPFPAEAPRLVETHISWVLLCGEDVLKLKKPVHMGFIDFSSLVRRDHFAHEEIRLNRRLAPELYLEVLAITGSADAPRFDGTGPLLEPAVHMRQFDPSGQLDIELESGRLGIEDIDEVARLIAAFQAEAPRVEAADPWGRTEAVMEPIRENYRRIREVTGDIAGLEARLEALQAMDEERGAALAQRFAERRAGGFIREGHGDLHLGNIARTPWGIRAFDCLEFSPALRWLDVVNDLAFLFMDLLARGRSDLGWRLVNTWVADTSDHAGLRLLNLYTVYRAMVRVKVAALRRSQQTDPDARRELEEQMTHYLDLAEQVGTGVAGGLVLMHGLSGSGKSRAAQGLAARLGAVHLRSDQERKRLLGPAPPEQLYGAGADELTYRHLEELSAMLLTAGHRVVVDATFLGRTRRERFIERARQLGLPTAVVACEAPEDVLVERVQARLESGTDPSDADASVVYGQRDRRERPTADEGALVRIRDTRSDAPEAESADIEAIEKLFRTGS